LLKLTATAATFIEDEHPALQKGQTAKIELNGEQVGWIGALAPNVAKELSLPKCYLFEISLSAVLSGSVAKYEAFSQYQEVQRDIALVLNKAIPVAELIDSIEALQQSDFVGVRLFDVYIGENIEPGKKSVAFNLTYQSLEKTLSDEEISVKLI
jgi:phenylalanyl-tRNA synthetase beta chain